MYRGLKCNAQSNQILYFENRMAQPNPAYSFLNTIRYGFDEAAKSDALLCMDHDHELLKPQVISTWMPSGVGSKPGKRTIFAETQVCCTFT